MAFEGTAMDALSIFPRLNSILTTILTKATG